MVLEAKDVARNAPVPVAAATLTYGQVVPDVGWVDNNYLGIDEGLSITMIENFRSGLIWRVMRRNPYLRRGLERAGFQGGWLDTKG